MSQLPVRWRVSVILALFAVVPLLSLPFVGLANWQVLWFLPAALPLAVTVGFFIGRPVEELIEAAIRLKAGDLKARPFVDRHSALNPVAAAMTELAGRLESVTRNLEQQVAERTAALARKADQLRAVGQVGQQVAAVLEPEGLMHFVARVVRGTFGYDLVAVLQRHGEHLVLTACAARGEGEAPLGRAFPLAGMTSASLANAMEGQEVVTGSTSLLLSSMEAQSELAVPMRLGDRVLGLLVVQSRRPDAFDEEDRFTVRTIVGQVAVALENVRLFEAERQLRDFAVTEERNRMAREIHDTLAQAFMGIIIQLRAMQGVTDPETARTHFTEAESLARDGLQEARRSVWNLRPLTLEGKGLAGALAEEVAALQRRAALSTRFEAEGNLERLPPAVEAGLLRIAQEALHNAVKYARAAHVHVRLVRSQRDVTLRVSDDGIGFDPRALSTGSMAITGGGFGLNGMADRARMLGGALDIESAPGEGCRVVARVPLR